MESPHGHHAEPRWPYGGRGHRDPQPNHPALQLENVCVRYAHASRLALDQITLEVPTGCRVALVGPNGAGKSTILKVAAGLVRPDSGQILIYGNRLGACHHRSAYLPQRAELDWTFPITVEQLVMTGRYVHLGWFGRPTRNDNHMVHESLDRLGLRAQAGCWIYELSGGQQQRCLLARAMVQEASLYLLDEPLNAVDAMTREAIDTVLAFHVERGGSVLAATHDLGQLTSSFDLAIHLDQGRMQTIRRM